MSLEDKIRELKDEIARLEREEIILNVRDNVNGLLNHHKITIKDVFPEYFLSSPSNETEKLKSLLVEEEKQDFLFEGTGPDQELREALSDIDPNKWVGLHASLEIGECLHRYQMKNGFNKLDHQTLRRLIPNVYSAMEVGRDCSSWSINSRVSDTLKLTRFIRGIGLKKMAILAGLGDKDDLYYYCENHFFTSLTKYI